MKKPSNGKSSRSIFASGLRSLFWGSAALILTPAIVWSQHTHSTQSSAPGVGVPAIAFDLKSLDGKPRWTGELSRQTIDDEFLRQLVRSVPGGNAADQ